MCQMNRFITLICFKISCADPENSDVRVCVCVGGGGVLRFFFFSHQSISQRAVRTSLEKQLDLMGPIASRGSPYKNF